MKACLECAVYSAQSFPVSITVAMLNPVPDNLEGLKSLDPQAISTIFDRYFPEIYRFFRYRLNDDRQAEDLASEVFVRLLEAARAGRGPESYLKGWLFSTASHVMTDHLRKSYRMSEKELPETLPDGLPGLWADYEQKERANRLKEAMFGLTGEQQTVLTMRFGQGLSLEETAVLMKKKPNAIKQLQFRALAALNRVLCEMP